MIGLALCSGLWLSGCALTSGVIDAGNGTYMISAHASAVRGGAAGATGIAYGDANAFCAQKAPGSHAVALTNQEREVYQSSFGGSFNQNGGGFGGGTFAAGNTQLYFRCGS